MMKNQAMVWKLLVHGAFELNNAIHNILASDVVKTRVVQISGYIHKYHSRVLVSMMDIRPSWF